jgi:hypothetical protein
MQQQIDKTLLVVAILDAINTLAQWVTKASSLGLSPNTWLGIGLGVFFACILAIVLRLQKKTGSIKVRKQENKIGESTAQLPKGEVYIGKPQKIIADGIHFYENREQAGGILSMFADTSELDLFCFSGYELNNYLSTGLKGKVKRLILISPSFGKGNPQIQNFIKTTWRQTPEFYYDLVKNLSDRAVKEGIKVYWLYKTAEYGIAVSNHRSDKAWIKIEKFEFGEQPLKWPTIIVYRANQEMLYNALFSLYEEIRDKAKEYPQCLQSEPSGEMLSEHIIKHTQSIAEQLKVVTYASYSASVYGVFKAILEDPTFGAWYKSNPIRMQLAKLFKAQLDEMMTKVGVFERKTKAMNAGNVSEIYNDIRNINFAYRSTVSDLIELLNNLVNEGAPNVWEREPLLSKLYRELRDNYDELMTRIKNLKVYVPEASKSLLPSDDQLTKFDRIPGIIG